jgi:PAT family beta-lactamase induction signal transducer AmpG
MNPWFIYTNRNLLTVFFLGIASGLPLLLTSSTLSVWLAEAGISKTAVGALALAGMPYTFKFLWAPAIDRVRLPFLADALGRRKSWLFLVQICLMLAILGLGMADPNTNLYLTFSLAILVAFLSATQDIVIDALRVELLDSKTQGAGAAAIVFGYRVGMIVAGALALYLATFFGWFWCYAIMALVLAACMLNTLLVAEPKEATLEQKFAKHHNAFYQAVVAPFQDFMQRRHWMIILLFVISYKLGDAFAANMSSYFFIDLGFSKIDIANVTKVFGLGASIVGGLVGGALIIRIGIFRALLSFGILAVCANLLLVLLAISGKNNLLFASTIIAEHIATGMSSAAFVAYLSSLCNRSFTATQYALFSAIASFGRTTFSSLSGAVAENTSWPFYFIAAALLALPALFLLLWLANHNHFKSLESS